MRSIDPCVEYEWVFRIQRTSYHISFISILKCDFCLWWLHNEFAARFVHAQWQCSCLISLPCEIVDPNCSNVMLRHGPSLLETFEGTNFVYYACYYAYHKYSWLRFDDDVTMFTQPYYNLFINWQIMERIYFDPTVLLATSLELWKIQRVLC